MQEFKAKYEINYPPQKIKLLTPYLDEIEVPNNVKNGKKRYLTMKQRAFAWYYVYNLHSKADAYRRSHRGIYNKKLGIIEISDDVDSDNCTPIKQMDAIKGGHIYSNVYIQAAIKLVRKKNEEEFLTDTPQTLVEMLQIMATYDPTMFIKKDGSPKFKKLTDIPKKYRCCIEGIEKKYYGKDADKSIVIIKLTDRKKALADLMKLIPNIVAPERLELIHKTIDSKGKEVGFDPGKLTDEELIKRYAELKPKRS